jgi:ABC-type multidrug transport system ATPase subunit
MTTEPVIEISDLRKAYGGTTAVDGVTLTVRRGEVFRVLGPNGAGKTTTVETAVGLRTPAAWGLTKQRSKPFGGLSGGQKQRLFIALALLGKPADRRAGRAHHRARPGRPPRHLGPWSRR